MWWAVYLRLIVDYRYLNLRCVATLPRLTLWFLANGHTTRLNSKLSLSKIARLPCARGYASDPDETETVGRTGLFAECRALRSRFPVVQSAAMPPLRNSATFWIRPPSSKFEHMRVAHPKLIYIKVSAYFSEIDDRRGRVDCLRTSMPGSDVCFLRSLSCGIAMIRRLMAQRSGNGSLPARSRDREAPEIYYQFLLGPR